MWGGVNGLNTSATYKLESECMSGKCLDFDGYDDHLEIPYNLNLSPSEVTISFWIKLTSNPNVSADNNWRSLYRNMGGGAPFYLYLEEVKQINFSVVVSGISYRYIGGSFCSEDLTVGKWSFLTYTYSHDGYGKAYKDGILSRSGKMKTSAGSECSGGVLQKSASANWRISWPAGTSTPNGNGSIPGIIDEFKIYAAPLTQAQIKQNYITGLNSMFANGNISKEDYNKRINSLAYNN